MSGICGLFDLTGNRRAAGPLVRAMLPTLAHRGPDGESIFEEAGLALGWRHLQPTGTPEGPGPLVSRDGNLAVVCQGRPAGGPASLLDLWTKEGERLVDRLRGGFALALWDGRQRCLFLARDRFGTMPLYWAMHDGRLLFASEIKALLAGGVPARADRLGIDHVFTFLGLPAARTCFEGVQALRPGHTLSVREGEAVVPHRYWDIEFPDNGQEEYGDPKQLSDRLHEILLGAVARRVPTAEAVASGVSGGIDCATLVALAGQARGRPLPSFTLNLESVAHNETPRALRGARASGSEPTVITCTRQGLVELFPQLIRVAENPVPDPSCVALMRMAQAAKAAGFSQLLSGDGADDLFAGYPWFRIHRLLGLFDWIPGVRPSQWLRRAFLAIAAPQVSWANIRKAQELLGGHPPWLDLYGLIISAARTHFYSAEMKETLKGRWAFEDLELDLTQLKRWHPFNQALYIGQRVHIPGLQLQGKGDRPAMASGVQTHLPFLDEEVVAFANGLAPSFKLRRLRDKYLLRRVAERYLPRDIAWKPKTDFVAPFDSLYGPGAPAWVEQLLSEESLRRAGYFDPAAVRMWRERYPKMGWQPVGRLHVEISLSAVVATQLWHQTFIAGGLADLPGPQEIPGGPAGLPH